LSRPAERVLHRAGGGRVDVTLDRRQVHDVLADEEVGDLNPLGENFVEDAHARARAIGHPRHVFWFEVELHRHVVRAKDRDVVVQVLAFERVGDDGLVLHAGELAEPFAAQRADRALELPRRRVRGGERVVPRDVVLRIVGAPSFSACFMPASSHTRSTSSRMVSGLTLRTATVLRFAIREIYLLPTRSQSS
jgi:hypothetical protein